MLRYFRQAHWDTANNKVKTFLEAFTQKLRRYPVVELILFFLDVYSNNSAIFSIQRMFYS